MSYGLKYYNVRGQENGTPDYGFASRREQYQLYYEAEEVEKIFHQLEGDIKKLAKGCDADYASSILAGGA